MSDYFGSIFTSNHFDNNNKIIGLTIGFRLNEVFQTRRNNIGLGFELNTIGIKYSMPKTLAIGLIITGKNSY